MRAFSNTAVMALVAFSLAVGLSACAQEPVPAAPAGNAQLVEGQEIWTKNCTSCHGRTGNGGRGAKLSEGRVVLRFKDAAEQELLVSNGKGAMPAFSGRLAPEQIAAVVAYTREVL